MEIKSCLFDIAQHGTKTPLGLTWLELGGTEEEMNDYLGMSAASLNLRFNGGAHGLHAMGVKAFGWHHRRKVGKFHGFGMGFARYKNLSAYCSVFMEITVEQDTLQTPRYRDARKTQSRLARYGFGRMGLAPTSSYQPGMTYSQGVV